MRKGRSSVFIEVEVDLSEIDTIDLRAELERRKGEDEDVRAGIRDEEALVKAIYYARRDLPLSGFYLANAIPELEPLARIVERAH